MKKLIFNILSDNVQPSSKRFCGVVGWFAFLACSIYATVINKEPPQIVETVGFVSAALLGLDTIASLFKKA